MAVRKRNIQIKFYVTEEEKQLIDEKLSQLPAKRMGGYLRKMAIDGYIINLDTADIKTFTGELAAIGRNINQIAKRVNAGDSLYQADIQEIRERLDEIWQLQRHILLKNDGTFNYSGGTADTGCARLNFTGNGWEYKKICNITETEDAVTFFATEKKFRRRPIGKLLKRITVKKKPSGYPTNQHLPCRCRGGRSYIFQLVG